MWQQISRILLTFYLCFFATQVFAETTFEAWLTAIQQAAIDSGVSKNTAEQVCQHIQFLPNIIKLDYAQPEFITPFLDYYQQRVDAKKVQIGQEKLLQLQDFLNQLERDYGVPKAYLVAFWGMETNYGADKGHVDVLSSLATLGFEGRRADFFRQQLIDAMRIIDQTNMPINHWLGSWAGAFGHMQFMPSTFMIYAVDGDGDQKIDLVVSEKDALTSAANYLSQVGWQTAQPTVLEVELPDGFAMQQAQLNDKKTISAWMALGVMALQAEKQAPHKIHHLMKKSVKVNARRLKIKSHPSGKMLVRHAEKSHKTDHDVNVSKVALNQLVEEIDTQAAIVLPQGWQGPAFMVFDNFDAIMDWNRSVKYALSVAQLAQQLNYQAPVLAGAHAEMGALSFVQMQQLQSMLNSLGFDAGEADGFPGLQTQSAIRAYQRMQHLPADGYASPSLFHGLNQQSLPITQ